MRAWLALFALVTLSALGTGTARVLKTDVLSSLKDVITADSVLQALRDPSHQSGAADCSLDVQRFFDALGKQELWAFSGEIEQFRDLKHLSLE